MSDQDIIVICPKHGEHEYAITVTIPGHEGAWCQLCWMESLGPSLPYKKLELTPPQRQDVMQRLEDQFDAEFKTMSETNPAPEGGWNPMPKE